ncbi:hypothetical protein EHM69_12865, partial [candidate division KSB1 bacterium]
MRMKHPLWTLGILTAGLLLLVVASSFAKITAPAARRSIGPVGSSSETAAVLSFHEDRRPLDDVILADDFESYQNGRLPSGWTSVDRDNGYSAWFSRRSTWQVYSRIGYSAHSGSHFLMCHFNDNSVPNDDWLILPQQRILGTPAFSYWA